MKLPYRLFRKDGTWWAHCLGEEMDLKQACQGPRRRLKANVEEKCEDQLKRFVKRSEKKHGKQNSE